MTPPRLRICAEVTSPTLGVSTLSVGRPHPHGHAPRLCFASALSARHSQRDRPSGNDHCRRQRAALLAIRQPLGPHTTRPSACLSGRTPWTRPGRGGLDPPVATQVPYRLGHRVARRHSWTSNTPTPPPLSLIHISE